MTMKNCDTALIGGGYWGKNLARNLSTLGVLHTLCDVSPQTLSAYQSQYPGVRLRSDPEEVFNDSSVSKVFIAAPAEHHFELAQRAIHSGKDVFVEKPLAMNIHEGAALAALARTRGKILMVGHLLQYHPCIDKIKELVAAGNLGKLQYITSNRLNLGKIRREENALWSFAPHDISVLLSLVGNQVPETVQCTGEAWLTPGVADTTLTAMKFHGGVRADVFVSWLNPFKEQKLTVVGSQAMIVFDDTLDWEHKLVLYRHAIAWRDGIEPSASKTIGEPLVVDRSEPLRRECEHFLECCEKRMTPKTDAEEGLRVLRVLAMAQQSLEHDGKPVHADQIQVQPHVSYESHPTAVIDSDATIGEGCKIWHFSHICSHAKLGDQCNLGQNVFVGANVTLGNRVKVQNNVSIYTGTEIHDDVFLGPSCVLTNVKNPRSQVVRRSLYEKTVIRRGATIGANATIVCGVDLGRYCFVAAGAVVTDSFPDYALVMGVPAKQKGWMSRHGHPLEFDASGRSRCPESGLEYVLELGEHDQRVRCLTIDEECPLPESLAFGSKSYDSHKRDSRDT
jgi:UDP-2-acetamido-3-amino-2,3-dideoxy-glucuronate N-acetyltransferase